MAESACDPPLFTLPEDGVTVTLLTGGGFCCPEEGALLTPLQPVKNAAMARMNQGKRLGRKGDLPEVNEILPYTLLDAEPRLVMLLFPQLDWPHGQGVAWRRPN